MKTVHCIAFLIFFFFSASIHGQQSTAITNVTILDVQHQKLLHAQTVLINDDTIASIDPFGKRKIPVNARIIDGSGKYLMPGMTDAHVHFFGDGSLYCSPDWIDLREFVPYDKQIADTKLKMKDFLIRYLQCGITTVIDVGSNFHFLELRDSLSHRFLTPSIYMAGPIITTWNLENYSKDENDDIFVYVQNTEQAKTAVQKQLPFHPDLIKIIYIADGQTTKHVEDTARKILPIVRMAIEEAHRNKLKVAVHATQRITAQLAVEAGCDYLAHGIDDEIVSEEFIQLLKNRNVTLCPTLNVQNGIYKTFVQENTYSVGEIKYSEPFSFGTLFDLQDIDPDLANAMKQGYLKEAGAFAYSDTIRRINMQRMAQSGVLIASGTDAGNIRALHASSFLEELLSIHRSGMNNWQVIESATINPIRILGKELHYGSISPGKVADMILLSENPIDSLSNLSKISIVFKNGKPLVPDSLLHTTPEMVVQNQLNACNANNMISFLEYYCDDVELFNFPDSVIGVGKETLKERYSVFFDIQNGKHFNLLGRTVFGNIVIDKIRIRGESTTAMLDQVIIYVVEDSRIRKVYFIGTS